MTKVLAVLKSVVSPRVLVALCLMVVSAAFAQTTPTPGEISEADFTDLATKILTYLGYAISAGITVLVAVIGARRAWSFLRKFF